MTNDGIQINLAPRAPLLRYNCGHAERSNNGGAVVVVDICADCTLREASGWNIDIERRLIYDEGVIRIGDRNLEPERAS